MARIDMIYKDGTKTTEYRDTTYAAVESARCRATWPGMDEVRVYTTSGDWVVTMYAPDEEGDE